MKPFRGDLFECFVMDYIRQNRLYSVIIDMSRINLFGPKILKNFVNQESGKAGAKVEIPVDNGNIVCCKTETEIFSLPKNERPADTKRNKVFKFRNSLLTDMLERKDFRSLYNVIIVGVICIYLSAMTDDFIKYGTVNLGFGLIARNFNRWPILLGIWFGMKMSTVLVYYAFFVWASIRTQYLSTSKWARIVWDLYFICLAITYQIGFFIIPAYQTLANALPVASAAAVLLEQVRFTLKTYSFLRTVIPRVIFCKSHELGCSCMSSMLKYFYFLLAPTLIYKDEYPRTKKIRKLFLLGRTVEMIIILLFFAFIFERYLLPPLENFKSVQTMPLQLVSALFANILPSLVVFLIGFYAFYHSGFNALAECLRFGDRLSYRDWWNATSFVNFYRTWNIPVQDWLYLYIYKDSYTLFKNRILSIALVFLLSAIMHDYVMALSFGFFYPVLTIMFGFIGMIFVFLPKLENSYIFGNMCFWFLHSLGSGIMNTLYISEYYSRLNCPSTIESPLLDFFVPRSWTCSTA